MAKPPLSSQLSDWCAEAPWQAGKAEDLLELAPGLVLWRATRTGAWMLVQQAGQVGKGCPAFRLTDFQAGFLEARLRRPGMPRS